MKTFFLCGVAVILGAVLMFVFIQRTSKQGPVTLFTQPTPVPTPLVAYSFEHLAQTTFPPAEIRLGRVLKETADFRRQVFTYTFSPRPGSLDIQTVSGAAHIPKESGTYPVIVMLRGYVPPEKYAIGAGTNPSAEVFAKAGFITLAPDFLGFGESSPRGEDSFENRFQTYTTTLSLLSSLSLLNSSLSASYSGQIRADISLPRLWGHSNGGHIALSVLSITGVPYPTVLWAPVSKSFPYTNLVYTDEDDDQGKAYRQDLARFETIYDTDLFSPPIYYERISAPIQIHQGTADEEVPYWWSDEFVDYLKKNNKEVGYHKYPGSDHNLRPAWDTVVLKSIEFFHR